MTTTDSDQAAAQEGLELLVIHDCLSCTLPACQPLAKCVLTRGQIHFPPPPPPPEV